MTLSGRYFRSTSTPKLEHLPSPNKHIDKPLMLNIEELFGCPELFQCSACVRIENLMRTLLRNQKLRYLANQ